MENTDPQYWLKEFPLVVEDALAYITEEPKEDVASDLALIAGDYSTMSDDEVLTTYINEKLGKLA